MERSRLRGLNGPSVVLLAILWSGLLIGGALGHTSDDWLEWDANYSPLEMPPKLEGNEPLMINVSINLRNILEVNEKSQYISVETSLRMMWRDARVRLRRRPAAASDADVDDAFVSYNGKAINRFWIPDVFVDQAKDLRTPTLQVRPASLRVYPGSVLRYSARVNYDVSCNMDFHKYPIDRQVCEIKYESFGHTSSQLSFRWLIDDSNVNPNITLDQFEPEVVFQSSYATDYYAADYPGLILRIYLTRLINYHLVQTYLPSLLFVTIAWMSLFVNPEAIPGRVSMVMMTLLTLMAMFSGVRQSTPKVSYISYLDVWMVMCIIFIFFVLIEFSIVTALLRKNKKPLAERIERRGVYVIPCLFVCFNVAYWACLFIL